jgi:hypothetical protein
MAVCYNNMTVLRIAVWQRQRDGGRNVSVVTKKNSNNSVCGLLDRRKTALDCWHFVALVFFLKKRKKNNSNKSRGRIWTA